MSQHVRVVKITGPPGCGKTTEILRLIKDALQTYFPSQIGAVSFTNAAVETVKDRIAADGFDRKLVKNVRTLHSHCFKLLGLNSKNIAEYRLKEFNELYPALRVNGSKPDEGSMEIHKKESTGTYLYNQMNLLRNHLLPRDRWPADIRTFASSWRRWMEQEDIWDFTRMLEETAARGLIPKNIEVLFVDESQDLTPLQMKVIQLWKNQIEITYFAGDSDQCIFRFGGAQPEAFIELEYTSLTHLQQSYRVPPAVHAYASRVSEQIKNRENTVYEPDLRRGDGYVLSAREPDLSIEGNHMIICRCNYQVTRWIKWLMHRKVLWYNPYRLEDLGWNPQLTKSWQAIMHYQRFLNGESLSLPDLHTMIACTIASGNIRRGFKNYALNYSNDDGIVDMFESAILGLTDQFMDPDVSIAKKFKVTGRSEGILLHMLGSQKSIAATPRVIVGTIHSVKGGEADNVWIDTGIPALIWHEMRKSERVYYDEARVAYVAATRARNRLGIIGARNRSPVYPTV